MTGVNLASIQLTRHHATPFAGAWKKVYRLKSLHHTSILIIRTTRLLKSSFEEYIHTPFDPTAMVGNILDHVLPKTLAIAIVAVLCLVKVSQWIKIELKIRALGGHAPKIRTWLPYGIYLLPPKMLPLPPFYCLLTASQILTWSRAASKPRSTTKISKHGNPGSRI